MGIRNRPRLTLLLAALLVLAYALPLFVPPPATAVARPAPDADLWTRLFPDVPGWWVAARLLALFLAAVLVAVATPRSPFHLEPPPAEPPDHLWRHPWVPWLALGAAAAHALWLPWRAALSPVGQTAFMLWFALPAAILAWGTRHPSPPGRTRVVPADVWAVGFIVAGWAVVRSVIAWHSPRAADVVDTWRPFGGFVQLAATQGNFLIASMDPDLPGLSAMLLFFHGLPVAQLAGHVPGLTWMQVGNTIWIGVCAALMAALARGLLGPAAAVIAAAAFLFSPFMLLFQLTPTPSALFVFPVLMAYLVMRIFGARAPAALALLGAVIGIAAGMPMLLPVLGLVGVLALLALWQRPRFPGVVVAIAVVSLLVGLVASLPTPATVVQMYARYVATEIPVAVAEPAVMGQLAPTIEDWFGGPLPEGVPLQQLQLPITRGWLLVPAGALLSPFATARWSLRSWGDSMWEPLSAGLLAIGLAVALRHARRDRVALAVLAAFAVSLLPGFSSSYDRASLIRLLAAPVPVTLLAATGFQCLWLLLPEARRRFATALAAAAAIVVSGTVLFDVVNPRLLAASSLGMMVRAVEARDLPRVALLTSFARDARPDVPLGRRYWELDWLRHNHPYIADVVRTVPEEPIPLVAVEPLTAAGGGPPERDVVFWSPALEQTLGVTDRLCARWPAATLFTITDRSGRSRVHAARLGGRDWRPAVEEARWRSQRCGDR